MTAAAWANAPVCPKAVRPLTAKPETELPELLEAVKSAQGLNKSLEAASNLAVGRYYLHHNEIEKAEEALKAAHEADSSSDEVGEELFNCYKRQKKAKEAKALNAEADSHNHPPVNCAPYMANVQRSIKMRWNATPSESTTPVDAEFFILPDGKLLAAWVVQSSGDAFVDAAALAAIARAAPFGDFPDKSYPVTPVHFRFDSSSKK